MQAFSGVCELEFVELFVDAVLPQQLLMRSRFPDPAVVHDDDRVGVLDGGEAVGDHNGRASPHQMFQRLGDHALRLGVDIGGRLVEHEDGGIVGERPGKGEELALSGGKCASALGHRLVVAARELFDKVVRIDNPGGALCSLQGNRLVAKRDIALDVPGEEKDVLLHLPDRAPEHTGVNVFDIYSVDQNLPFLNVKISSDEIQDR